MELPTCTYCEKPIENRGVFEVVKKLRRVKGFLKGQKIEDIVGIDYFCNNNHRKLYRRGS